MFAYITAYRRDGRRSENMQLMKSLGDDSAKIVCKTDFSLRISHWYGWRRPVYLVSVNDWLPLLNAFPALSRKYGQNTFIVSNYIYDVATGKKIGNVSIVYLRTKTKPTNQQRWVYLGNDLYLFSETSVPLDLLDTLNILGSAPSPSDCIANTAHGTMSLPQGGMDFCPQA